MNRRLATWILMAGCALLASFFAHAAFLALQRSHGVIVILAYDAQNPIADAAVITLAIAATFVIRQLIAGLRAGGGAELLLPAFAGVLRLGLARCMAALVALQLASGFFGLLFVQAVSLHGRVNHVFGPSDPQALAVQIVVGAIVASLLWALANAACRHVRAVVRMALAFVEWIARPENPRVAREIGARILESSVPPPPVLARGIANRPPPALLAFPA
jgi:hypothetical protein